MATEAGGFISRGMWGQPDWNHATLRVSLHTGPIPERRPLDRAFANLDAAIANLGVTLGQINPEPFERLAEWIETYGADEWPSAEDDGPEPFGQDLDDTGKGDPLAEVHGLSYDSVLAEIDALLRGE